MQDTQTTEYVGEYTFNPVVYHNKGEINSNLNGLLPLDIYVTDDYLYAYDPELAGWMKLDNTIMDSETLMFIDESKINIILDHIEEFELTEESDYFVVTYTGEEEQYKDLVHIAILDTGAVTLPGEFGAMYEEVKESMEVNGGLKIYIDKDSFYITKLEIDYDMSMTVNGIETNTIHESITTFSDFNTLDEVVIPEDVLENIIEMPRF